MKQAIEQLIPGSKPYPDHICRFNDGVNNCDCFAEGVEFGKSDMVKPHVQDWEEELEKVMNQATLEISREPVKAFIRRIAAHERAEGKKEVIQWLEVESKQHQGHIYDSYAVAARHARVQFITSEE